MAATVTVTDVQKKQTPNLTKLMSSPPSAQQGWMSYKLESRCLGKYHNLRYSDDATLMAESQED